MAGIFDTVGNKLNNLGFAGNMGLLSAGANLLEGGKFGDSVNQGLNTYQNFNQLSEDKKRKAVVQKLIAEGNFTDQEKALLAASKNPIPLAVQIKNQKATANKPLTATEQKYAILEKLSIDPASDHGKRFLLGFDTDKSGPNPLSSIGKLTSDFNNKLIDEKNFKLGIEKLTSSGGKESFSVTMQDGTVVKYGNDSGGGSGGGKMTEQQAKLVGYNSRITDAMMDDMDIYDKYLASYPDRLLGKDPTGYARGAFQSKEYQMADSLKQQFITPIIRIDTGAAIQNWETQLYDQMYFPQPGDSEEVIKLKRRARRLALGGMRNSLPPLLRIKVDPAFAKEFNELQSQVLDPDSILLLKNAPQSYVEAGEIPENTNAATIMDSIGAATTIEQLTKIYQSNKDKLTEAESIALQNRIGEVE